MIIHSPIISGSLTFADGATFTLPDNGIYSGSFSGSLQVHRVQSDLIPDTSASYDLGSEAFPFKDLYISSGTGFIGGIGISAGVGGINIKNKSDGSSASIGVAGITIGGALGDGSGKNFDLDENGDLNITDDATGDGINLVIGGLLISSSNGAVTMSVDENGNLGTTNSTGQASSNLSGSFTGSVQDLVANGNATFNNNVNILGTLDVSGLSSLDGGIDVDGAFTVADSSGNVSTSGTLGVTGDTTLQNTDIQGTFSIGSTAVTSTAAELNILDGVTSDATELNLLDGSTAGTVVAGKAVVYGASGEVNATTLQIGGTSITSTAAELNILDGVTATATELNILDGVTATATELNLLDGVTATTAELNILDGVTATTAELNYVDGVTSNIQTQLDGKLTGSGEVVLENADKTGFTGASSITTLGTITTGTWNGTTIAIANGGTGATTAAGALTNLGLTATAAELNILDGVTVDATKINYLSDVTGNLKNYIDTEVAGIVDSAPGTLDTLNELAAALGDDPNFATTISTTIGGKVSQSLQVIAGNGLTGGGNLTADRTFNVVGTTDRISVSADAIDIASTYAGQSTITTLGTITTGTWNGTTIAIANGGTGATTAAGARSNLGVDTKADTYTGVSGDVTITSAGVATVADDSHNHIIGNVDGLQAALDAKQASGTYNTIIGTDTDISYTGATVLSAMTMTDGVIQSHSSRTLTLADLGYTGATNANYITNNNQLTNGAGYSTTTGTVTSVATGNGLTGGTITSTGTLSMSGTYTGTFSVSGAITATGDITAYASSDERLKDNIEVISNPIEKVQQLKGVTWNWNDNASEVQQSLPNVGVIAQDVEKVLPQLVRENEGGYKAVDYDKLVGLLIEAIKDQQNQIDELKSKLS